MSLHELHAQLDAFERPWAKTPWTRLTACSMATTAPCTPCSASR